MNIDPRHLEQLATIVEFGTFNEAAKQLGTSQPALSRMVANLEKRIGTPLFERSTRPLIPTEAGRNLARHGRSITSTRRRAAEDLSVVLKGMSGQLNIGTPPFFSERVVGDTLASFLQERSHIEINLVSEYFPQLERKLLLNQLDVVICPLRLLTASKGDLFIDPLFDDEHVVVGRKDHWLLERDTIAATDLEEATWISHADNSMLQADMAAALTSIGVQNLRFAFKSGSAGAILEMLRKTDFLTVLPRYALRENENSDSLVALPVRFRPSTMSVGLVTPTNRLESPLLKAFASHARDYVARQMPVVKSDNRFGTGQ